MTKIKSTRASKAKETAEQEDIAPRANKVPALRKIFFIAEQLLADNSSGLRLERFFHSGRGRIALFVTRADQKQLLEVLEFAEPRRSWLIDNEVCSNGRIYLTTPVDVTLLALHHIRKHCTQKALALDSIHDDQDASVTKLLTGYVDTEQLRCVADVKTAGDLTFYKYNAEKALAWLALKTRAVVSALKKSKVHCGRSALSQNYARSERVVEEALQEGDYLRMACDIVGGYIDLELHEQLKQYLEIPKETQAKAEEKATKDGTKRKSGQLLAAKDEKKLKLDNDGTDAGEKLKNSSLLNDSKEDEKKVEESPTAKPKPLKERTLTTREKALAKSAKGTKSIASFFKK